MDGTSTSPDVWKAMKLPEGDEVPQYFSSFTLDLMLLLGSAVVVWRRDTMDH
jgi:hypothetical protein